MPCLAEPTVSACRTSGSAIRLPGGFLLSLTAVFVLFWGLGLRTLWAAEGRWAEVTREMFLTGDFFHPTIGGQPYFDKPLLTYWFCAAASIVTGVLNELTIRIPSALAGLAAVWATVKIGSRLWSVQTGRLAGWLLLTMYAFLFWARTGTAEMENVAAIMLAVAWYWSKRDRPGFWVMLVFYLIAFVGALTKGLTAVVVPICIVLPDMLVERRWRNLFGIKHIGALAIASLVYLAPFVYAGLTEPSGYHPSGLALVFQENVLRYFRPFDHKGPIYLYLYELPILLLPWTPLFVAAAVSLAKCRKELDHHTRWLLWALAAVFLFFTLSGSRRSYYILPILPLCALLIAVFLVWGRREGTEEARRKGLAVQKTLLTGLILFNLAIPVFLTAAGRLWLFHVPLRFHLASLVIGAVAAILGAGFDRLKSLRPLPDEQRAILTQVAVAAVLLAGYFCWQEDILDQNRTEYPFARELRAKSASLPPERIAMFPKTNANLLFYLNADKPGLILETVDQLRRFLESGLPGVVVTQGRYASQLPQDILNVLWNGQCIGEQVQSWESRSCKQEKWVAWFCSNPKETPHAAKIGERTDHAN